jgi:hypothetical protein
MQCHGEPKDNPPPLKNPMRRPRPTGATPCNRKQSNYKLTVYLVCRGGRWWERRYSSYSYLILALDGVSGQRQDPGALYPRGKEPRFPLDRRMGGPGAGLDAGARRKILCPCRRSNPDRPARNKTLYCLSYRGPLHLSMAY